MHVIVGKQDTDLTTAYGYNTSRCYLISFMTMSLTGLDSAQPVTQSHRKPWQTATEIVS